MTVINSDWSSACWLTRPSCLCWPPWQWRLRTCWARGWTTRRLSRRLRWRNRRWELGGPRRVQCNAWRPPWNAWVTSRGWRRRCQRQWCPWRRCCRAGPTNNVPGRRGLAWLAPQMSWQPPWPAPRLWADVPLAQAISGAKTAVLITALTIFVLRRKTISLLRTWLLL